MTLLEDLHGRLNFDVIHSQSGAASRYVTDGLKKKLRIPLVMTMHGTSRGEIKSIRNQKLGPLTLPRIIFRHYIDARFTKSMVAGCDAIIAISQELAREIPLEFGIPREKIRTIYNGIDTEKFRPEESPLRKEHPGNKIILSVSVLQEQKGVQYLIEAMRAIAGKIPKARLMVVGDGTYRKSLQAMSKRLGLSDKVVFAGRISNAKLPDYYNLADVFAIPTVRVEGLPLIELESMSCARPVVASEIGGIPTVITNRENGILVEPGNVEALSAAIIEVLTDKRLAASLAQNARRTILNGFSRKKMVTDTVAVYLAVSGGKR
jgi:glycosyltransferase involved in cell wall biosynthesis